MNREKHAHAEDRNKQHRIVKRVFGSAGSVQNQRQSGTDYDGWHSIDFHNFPQAYLEQLEHISWLLVEGVGQQAVVTVHKQCPCKAGSPVDQIHDEYKIGQPVENHLIDRRFHLRFNIHCQQNTADDKTADGSQSLGGLPEDFLVTLDKQLIQVFKAFAFAGDRAVSGDHLFIGFFDRQFCSVHLVHHLGEQSLIDFTIVPKADNFPDGKGADWDKNHQYNHRHNIRQ